MEYIISAIILIGLYFILHKKYRRYRYFDNWANIREIVFIKYGKYCSKCGILEKLDVHHKIPKSLGGKDILENLIVLCRECHEEEHGYKIDEKSNNKNNISSEKMKIVSDSIYNGEVIKIIYKSHYNKKITNRKIKCIELYKKEYTSRNGYKGYHWMIRAYCYLRNSERNFYIKDIINVNKI